MRFHQRMLPATICSLAACFSLNANTGTGETDPIDEWNSLLAEIDSLNAEADSLSSEAQRSDTPPDSSPPSYQAGFFSIFSASLAAGGGYSDNILKTNAPLASWYAIAEADAFFTLVHPNGFAFTAFAYAQFTKFAEDLQVSGETVVLANLKAEKSIRNHAVFANLAYFYGDQVYDYSLRPELITDARRFRQQQPRLSLGSQFSLSEDLELIISPYGFYSFYAQTELEYWQAGIDSTLSWSLSRRLASESNLTIAEDNYIEDPGRNANASNAGTGPVNIQRIRIEQSLLWLPFKNWPLETELTLHGDWRNDDAGGYDDQLRYGPDFSIKFDTASTDITIQASHEWIDYPHRLLSGSINQTVRYDRQSASLAIEQDLPFDFRATFEYEWTRLNALDEDAEYTENKAWLILSKSF